MNFCTHTPQSHIYKNAYVFKHEFVYLKHKVRHTETEDVKASIHCFTPQKPAIAQSMLGQSQGVGTPSKYSMWELGIGSHGASSTAFPSTLPVIWISSRIAGTPTWNANISWGSFTP